MVKYEYYNSDDDEDLPAPPDNSKNWVWDDDTGKWIWEDDTDGEDVADYDDDFDFDSIDWDSYEGEDFEYDVWEIGIDYGEDT